MPPRGRRLLGNLLALRRRHSFRPRLTAHAAERDRSRVLALALTCWPGILDLASCDLGDHDGAGVRVGGTFFAFWS